MVVRGALVSISNIAAPLLPVRPATSTPLTATPWVPSAMPGRPNGEAQGCGAPPSTWQVKATGRLALNSIAGRRLRLSGGGALVIVTTGGSARVATAP